MISDGKARKGMMVAAARCREKRKGISRRMDMERQQRGKNTRALGLLTTAYYALAPPSSLSRPRRLPSHHPAYTWHSLNADASMQPHSSSIFMCHCRYQLVFLLTVLLNICPYVATLTLHLRGDPIPPQLRKRNHFSALDNAQNMQYYTNLTLGEKQFSVPIDTGRHVVPFLSLSERLNHRLSRLVPTCGLRTTFSIRRIPVSLLASNMLLAAFLAT
jgi:hypothetical protein